MLYKIVDQSADGSNRFGFQELKHPKLHFDTFCDFSLFQNTVIQGDAFQSEQDQEQVYFEKFAVFLELIEMMTGEHVSLFKRLITRSDFQETLERIFRKERCQAKAVKLIKALTEFFFRHSSQKNLYEHPIIQQPAHLSNPHQPVAPQQIDHSSGR